MRNALAHAFARACGRRRRHARGYLFSELLWKLAQDPPHLMVTLDDFAIGHELD
jgi:hypothetical protein